jgi:hypothetical protein
MTKLSDQIIDLAAFRHVGDRAKTNCNTNRDGTLSNGRRRCLQSAAHPRLFLSRRARVVHVEDYASRWELEQRQRTAYGAGMSILVLRRLLILLTGIAFLAGAAVQAMPSARLMDSACGDAALSMTGDCCSKMAMKAHATRLPMKQMPCKGISLDCAKQLGCISSQALPAPSTALGSPTAYGYVAYWPPLAWRAGLSLKPGLFPPIAA